MRHRRTVKGSILRLIDEAPKRYSEVQRALVRPDKTVYISLKELLATDLISKEQDAAYAITELGKAALVKEDLEDTVADLVDKLGHEKATVARRCLEELLDQYSPKASTRDSAKREELVRHLIAAFN